VCNRKRCSVLSSISSLKRNSSLLCFFLDSSFNRKARPRALSQHSTATTWNSHTMHSHTMHSHTMHSHNMHSNDAVMAVTSIHHPKTHKAAQVVSSQQTAVGNKMLTRVSHRHQSSSQTRCKTRNSKDIT